jgi:hypothetical protein
MTHLTHHITEFLDGAPSFLELPFDVAEDVERIEVSYRATAGSTIDIGLSQGGHMRGWTGSEYAHVFVTADRASAGYPPGPLAGRWQVVLGLVRLAPGCEIQVEIRLIPKRPVWLAGELHSHTEHSDGGVAVSDAARRAQSSGCDFLALTDHNTTAQNRLVPEDHGLLLIPGMELTTYWGHCNLLGLDQPVADWLCKDISDVSRKMAEARERGATVVINHPCSDAGFNRWQPGWDVAFDAVEIWNGTWAQHNAQAVALWHSLLVDGRRIPCTGGSDFHLKNKRRHGRPANHLLAPRHSIAGILEAVREGANVVCSAPDEVMIKPQQGSAGFGEVTDAGAALGFDLTGLDAGCELHRLSERGKEEVVVLQSGEATFETALSGRFVRFEIWSHGQPRLFTNPIYAG